VPLPYPVTTTYTYQPLRRIDTAAFSLDILQSRMFGKLALDTSLTLAYVRQQSRCVKLTSFSSAVLSFGGLLWVNNRCRRCWHYSCTTAFILNYVLIATILSGGGWTMGGMREHVVRCARSWLKPRVRWRAIAVQICVCGSGSILFRPEQICTVTDSVSVLNAGMPNVPNARNAKLV